MNSLRKHWPEYFMEAAELGIFMVSACSVVALLEYPDSPLHQFLPNPAFRRVLTGIAMAGAVVPELSESTTLRRKWQDFCLDGTVSVNSTDQKLNEKESG